MTLTLWNIVEEVAVFEDDRMIGWDTRGSWYTVTTGEAEEADLVEAVVDMNDCEVRADMKKVMEVPEYDLPKIILVLKLALPPKSDVPQLSPFRTAWEILKDNRVMEGMIQEVL